MNTIPIEVSGDIWYNPERVQQQLDQTPPGQQVVLDFCAEGPSMYALGICNMLDNWLAKTNRNPDSIVVTCWSNATEKIPYPKKLCSIPSHFWKLSKSYWVDVPANSADHMFGLFVGRNSISRNVILHHVVTTWPSHFFVSKMKNNQQLTPWATDPKSLEKLDQWCPLDQESIIDWCNNCPVGSIDHKEIRDQFGDPDNHGRVNRSLLDYYNRFEIELVCETYTLGTTFFPTEKTVRPIMATKPVLIYGPVDFLKELHNMGFKTYSELWSEDYDNVEGPARWDHIKKIISYLTSLEQGRREQLLEHAKSIAMFNRQHLEKFIHDN
jgi:hypothetical protein